MQGIVKIPFFSSFYVIALVSHEKKKLYKINDIIKKIVNNFLFHLDISLNNVLLNFGKKLNI